MGCRGGTSAGTCAACSTSCPAGQYLSGCGGSFSYSKDCGNVIVSQEYWAAVIPPMMLACSTGTLSRARNLTSGRISSMSAIISSPGGAPLTLTFTQFDCKHYPNWVSVSSCASLDCYQTVVLLQRTTGKQIPGPMTSSTGIILIEWFSSDSPSWKAAWSSPISG